VPSAILTTMLDFQNTIPVVAFFAQLQKVKGFPKGLKFPGDPA